MPREKAVHFNPPGNRSFTACGRWLSDVQHNTNPEHTNCEHCKNTIVYLTAIAEKREKES